MCPVRLETAKLCLKQRNRVTSHGQWAGGPCSGHSDRRSKSGRSSSSESASLSSCCWGHCWRWPWLCLKSIAYDMYLVNEYICICVYLLIRKICINFKLFSSYLSIQLFSTTGEVFWRRSPAALNDSIEVLLRRAYFFRQFNCQQFQTNTKLLNQIKNKKIIMFIDMFQPDRSLMMPGRAASASFPWQSGAPFKSYVAALTDSKWMSSVA